MSTAVETEAVNKTSSNRTIITSSNMVKKIQIKDHLNTTIKSLNSNLDNHITKTEIMEIQETNFPCLCSRKDRINFSNTSKELSHSKSKAKDFKERLKVKGRVSKSNSLTNSIVRMQMENSKRRAIWQELTLLHVEKIKECKVMLVKKECVQTKEKLIAI